MDEDVKVDEDETKEDVELELELELELEPELELELELEELELVEVVADIVLLELLEVDVAEVVEELVVVVELLDISRVVEVKLSEPKERDRLADTTTDEILEDALSSVVVENVIVLGEEKIAELELVKGIVDMLPIEDCETDEAPDGKPEAPSEDVPKVVVFDVDVELGNELDDVIEAADELDTAVSPVVVAVCKDSLIDAIAALLTKIALFGLRAFLCLPILW